MRSHYERTSLYTIRDRQGFVKDSKPLYNREVIAEIRRMMRKGFARRFVGPLAGLALVLGLPAALPSSRSSPDPAWWEIRLSMTVKGEYSIQGGEAPLHGEFTCRARWEGSIEKDGSDFLLYRLKTEALEWSLVEKAAVPKGESLLVALETAEKPFLRLNYVLLEGSDLRFDYEFNEVSIPLHDSLMKFDLEFPRTTRPGVASLGSGYGDFVRRGSNRVIIPDSDLERGVAERKFSWNWRREKQVAKDAKTFVVTQRHTAEAIVSLRAH
jgi:hypothetical protein